MIPLSREKDLYPGGHVGCGLTKLQFGGCERKKKIKRKRERKKFLPFLPFENPQISNLSFSRFARSY